MTYGITTIAAFYARAKDDTRITAIHQSPYLALLYCYQQGGFGEMFTISRRELMPLARIQSVATYHKCIRELKHFGYIEYYPTYNYYQGSQVRLLSTALKPVEQHN